MSSGQAWAKGLQQFTGFLLRRAYVVSLEHAAACIGDDTAAREVPVLSLVRDEEPISQRRLGELLGLNRTTTGKLVDALEAKGWVTRDRDAHDRRSYALRLTAKGRTALAALHRSLDLGEARLTKSLTGAEQSRLAHALRILLSGDPTLAIEGLGSRCGYLIARAHRMLFRLASEALAPLGLSPRDFGILSALAMAQPCSQQQLASIIGVSPPAMMAFVDELEEAGLLERRRNPTDRRAYDVTLTPEGAAKLTAARRAAADVQAHVVRALGAATDADLKDLLRKVISAGALEGTALVRSNAVGGRVAMSMWPSPARRSVVGTSPTYDERTKR